jgi:hypothetical protein
MKKILFISILSAILITFASCNSLDVTPVGSLASGNFPATDNDAVALANGAYISNYLFSSSIAYMVDLPGDETQCGEAVTSAGAPIGTYQAGPSNGDISYVWSLLYSGVTTSNDVVDKLSIATTITASVKTRTINEAKFLRALYYYYIVQLWGDVPLVLHASEGAKPVRASVDAVYTQIVKDLTDATALPASYSISTDQGRATQGAAYALLAKTYLTWAQTSGGTPAEVQAKYQNAIDAANSVTGYSLHDNFLDNWNTSMRNDGVENIFVADHLINQFAPGDGFNHLCHCAFVTGFSQETPHLILSDTIQFYDSWDSRDQRKSGTYAKYLFNPNTNSVFTFLLPRYRKYIDTLNINTSASTRQIDRTILRYADVLLTKAEALNELNGAPTADAYNAINQVRRRAYKKYIESNNLSADAFDFKNLNYEQFRDSLRTETLHEFTYEQQRWFNLVRWKILVKTVKAVAAKATDPQVKLKANVSVKNYRFAIPQSERDLNPNLWQNYGFDGSTAAAYDASYQ